MKNIFFVLFIIGLVSCSANTETKKDKIIIVDRNEWKSFFASENIDGTFVLTKLNSDTLNIFNNSRAQKEYLPASTFKILNSLISLETGVIKDENEIIKWDGKKRFYDKWNKDQNLRTAIKYSCVWFYQELARRIGEEKMQYFLDTTKYGNSKIGTDIDKFWLEGDLRISTIEQIDFITRFLNKTLPFSKNNFDIVKDILIVDSTEKYTLNAKTGLTAKTNDQPQIGWYVGFIENKNGSWVFAMNIDVIESKAIKKREEVTKKILEFEGLLK